MNTLYTNLIGCTQNLKIILDTDDLEGYIAYYKDHRINDLSVSLTICNGAWSCANYILSRIDISNNTYITTHIMKNHRFYETVIKNIITELRSKYNVIWSDQTLGSIIEQSRSLDLFCWCIDNGCMTTPETLTLAIRYCRWDIVNYILRMDSVDISSRSVMAAIEVKNVILAKYLSLQLIRDDADYSRELP